MLEGVRSPHRYGQWTRFTYDTLRHRLTEFEDATLSYLWNGNVLFTSGGRVSAMRMVV